MDWLLCSMKEDQGDNDNDDDDDDDDDSTTALCRP
jgi:hypothetical protein